MPSHEPINGWSFWFPFVIHTALLFMVAPVVYWVAYVLLVADGRFDFGSVLALVIGIFMTYPVFGFSLLVVCTATTSITELAARLPSLWQRLVSRTFAGTALGSLLGGYVALKIARDGAAISAEGGNDVDLVVAGFITGLILGLALSGLRRLAYWWASAISRGLAKE